MGIDVAVNGFMELMECPWLVVFSEVIAYVFEPMILLILSLIVGVYVFFKLSRGKGVLFGMVMVVSGAFIFLAKDFFQRARPSNALIVQSSLSFPSGHATMATVFFGMLVYLFVKRKYRVWGAVVAGLLVLIIGLSRVYLRVHWLTDVLGGFVFGGIILALGIWIFKRNS